MLYALHIREQIEQQEIPMSPLNRREFLYSSVAALAATALASHLLAMSSEGARQPDNPVSQEAYTGPSVLSQFERDSNFVNWREQGLNLGARNRQYLR
jgi:hypothetical protein